MFNTIAVGIDNCSYTYILSVDVYGKYLYVYSKNSDGFYTNWTLLVLEFAHRLVGFYFPNIKVQTRFSYCRNVICDGRVCQRGFFQTVTLQ